MSRTVVDLTEDIWVDLGTAEMIIEVYKEGQSGTVFLNNGGQTEVAALRIPKGTAGFQYANTDGLDTISAMANAPGWTLVVDI